MMPRPPESTLFPYTTLFRSRPFPASRVARMTTPGRAKLAKTAAERRSEEHTSELQSLRHLVCRLLLEKKNILDGSSGHLLEAHRAPFFEHGQRGVNRSRDYGGIETFAIEVLMVGSIPIDSRAFGRPTLPDNGRYFTFAAWINEHEAFTAEAVEILLNDT